MDLMDIAAMQVDGSTSSWMQVTLGSIERGQRPRFADWDDFCAAFVAQFEPVTETGEQTLVPTFDGIWWLLVATVITILCSMFVQGAEGATFAIIPMIKKKMTGQIAGMAGAYGNVGAVVYLVLYSLVDAKTFFYIISAGAVLSFFYCWFALDEPKDAFAEEI